MQNPKHSADFNRSAAGIYLRKMESALAIKSTSQHGKDVQCIELAGGCTLYRVAHDVWMSRRKGKMA